MLLESSNTATMEINTLGTHLLGDTTQDGLWSGLDLAVMIPPLILSGGKTPGTGGEWTSTTTTTTLETCSIATSVTNTSLTQQLGDTIQDGP